MANFLDLRLEFDEDGKLYIRLYDKSDEFDFPIVIFFSKYEDIMFRGSILVSKLLKQGYSSQKLQTTFWKFYGRHTYLVYKFDTSVSHMLKGLFTNCDTWLVSLCCVHRDGCHMWGRRCSLFHQHMIPPIWGVHDVTHSLYIIIILLNLSVLGLCLLLNDSGLFAWIRLLCFGLILHYTVIPLFTKPSGLGSSALSLETGFPAWESPQNM